MKTTVRRVDLVSKHRGYTSVLSTTALLTPMLKDKLSFIATQQWENLKRLEIH